MRKDAGKRVNPYSASLLLLQTLLPNFPSLQDLHGLTDANGHPIKNVPAQLFTKKYTFIAS